jgi:N-methylhydantoinase A
MLVPDGDAVVIDIGSKSADMCLLKGGAAVLADPGHIGGIPLRRDCVDSVSLPIGGACRIALKDGVFQRGGADDPRLDSCFVAIGILSDAAGSAIYPDNAQALVSAIQMYLAEQIVRFATRRNIDPSKASLIVSGGTGCLLAAGIARAMGHGAVLLPQSPALAGASGLVMAPERFEASSTLNQWVSALDDQQIAQVFDALDQQVRAASGGQSPARYQLSMAPLAPMHPMTVTFQGRPKGAAELSRLYARLYEAQNGIRPPGKGFVGRISASFDRAPSLAAAETGAAASQTGMVHIPEGWHLTPVAYGFRLEATV